MSFKEDWLLVDDIPTKFLTWGTWVEDLKDEDVVLMITGNPGVTEFYLQFLSELHTLLKMPVWAVSHAGHEVPPRSKGMDSKRLYDLQQQIDHKASIIKTYVPADCKVHIIGHSMGAKIALELLKMPELEKQIVKCYMLFPTIERIGDTRNARFIRPFINYCGSMVIFLSWIFTLLPSIVQFHLLNTTFRLAYGGSSKSIVRAGVQLIQPSVLKNVFHLVNDEFVKIKELDSTSVNAYKHKMKFYFGTTDGWSPLEFYDNLKEKVPDVDATVCDKGMQHAFAIKSSTAMASIISKWVGESLPVS